jgi:hypothetical protein
MDYYPKHPYEDLTDSQLDEVMAYDIPMTDMNIANMLGRFERERNSLQQRIIPKRLAVILVAVISLALAGFAFINSAFFDKIFTDYSPGFPLTAEDDQIQKLLAGLAPGEILNTEIETADGRMKVTAIRGNTLDAISYAGIDSDMEYSETIPHPVEGDSQAPLEMINGLEVEPPANLENHIAAGEFIAALDSGEYALEHILLSSGQVDSLLYKGISGETFQIVPISGKLSMDEKYQEQTQASDITIGGKVFTVVELAESPAAASLYLYIDDSLTFSSVALYGYDPELGDYNATKEQLIKAAEHLVLYNEDANLPAEATAKAYYDEAFFEGISDSVIIESAGEIAAAINEAQNSGNDMRLDVWAKDGRSISVDLFGTETIETITLTLPDVEFGKLMETLNMPLPPYASQEWFPDEKLHNATLLFTRGRSFGVNVSGEKSRINMRFLHDFEIMATPLDTLAASGIIRIRGQSAKVVYDKDGAPYLIEATDSSVTVITIAQHGMDSILYTLNFDRNNLPADAFDKWLDSLA